MDLEKYGIPGVIAIIGISAIGWCVKFIKGMLDEHKKEREDLENLHRQERQDWNRINQHQLEDSNKSLNRNTEVLSELTTLIKSMKK